MQKVLLFIFLLIIVGATNAQNTRWVDSLDKVFNKMPDDVNKLKAYAVLTDSLKTKNQRRTLAFCFQALRLAETLNEEEYIASNLRDIGQSYFHLHSFDKSLEAYYKALRIYEKRKDFRGILKVYDYLIRIFLDTDITKSKVYLNKEEAILKKYYKDDHDLNYNLIGKKSSYFLTKQEFDSALIYSYKCLYLDKKADVKNPIIYCQDYSMIGLMLKKLGRYNEALIYYDSCKAILDTMPKDDFIKILYSFSYNNYGNLYNDMGRYKDAINALNKSILYAKESSDNSTMARGYDALADSFEKMGDYKNQAINLQKYHSLKDSLFTIDNKVVMVELESEYEMEKKNADLAEKESENLTQRNQRNVLLFLAGIILAVLSILAFFYRGIKLKNSQLATQNIQINTQKDQLQNLNTVKDRLFGIISHDLRSPLSALKTYHIMSENDTMAIDKKEKYKTKTWQAINSMTDMLDNLLIWANAQIKGGSPDIKSFSLRESVGDTISEVKAQADKKSIVIINKVDIDQINTDNSIISISVRNLLTNAIKFSNPGDTVIISSAVQNNKLMLSVEDHGIGMTPEKIQELNANDIESALGTAGEMGSGMGLFLIKELLVKIGGKLTVHSESGVYSRFTIEVPL